MTRFLSILLLATTAFGAETIIQPGVPGNPPGADHMYLQTAGGNTVPAIVSYTSDGNGHLVPIGSSGAPMTVNQGTSPWVTQDTAAESSLSSIDGKVPSGLQVTSNRLKVDGSGVTQPVSAASLPLPTGASTAANQATGNASVSSIDGKVPSGLTVVSSALKVDNSAVTQPVSASSLPLPTGASTSAKQDTGNTSLASIDAKLTAPLSTKAVGNASVNLARNDYSSINVTTAAYVELVASLSDNVNQVFIFDSSGRTLVLAVGAAASEVDKYYVVPGGNGLVPFAFASGDRVSIKAISGNATAGEINVTFLK